MSTTSPKPGNTDDGTPAARPDQTTVAMGLVATARQAMDECSRPDLQARLSVALSRVQRPTTVVCVVGEFKQGKSSLVNALLGGEACPVDDDLATSAITVVTGGDKPKVTVHRRQDGKAVAEEIDHRSLRDYVTERGNPDNQRGLERVEIQLKHPLLAKGLTLVDSPGMGGLGPASSAATLAFLPYADALLFVSDASAELSAPEVEFLRTASGLCPTVLFCLSKTDLYPSWRRIADIDAGHLERAGVRLSAIVALSSPLRLAAFAQNDRSLSVESGYQNLLGHLESEVIGKAKQVAVDRALQEAVAAVAQVRTGYATELGVLDDPAAAGALLAELEAAKSRLEHLKGPAARWSIVLNDRMADLSSEAAHRFRGSLRSVNRSLDERIEALSTTEDWEQLSRDLQTSVSGAVAEVFAELEAGAERTRQELADLLGDEIRSLPLGRGGKEGVDVASLWTDRSLETSTGLSGKVMSGFSILRGAQGGMMMFGMMGRFLPAAASAVLLSNPITIGFGAVFAGQALLDQRKRRLAAQRQQARVATRQFVDEVQFEVGNELSELVRSFQRQLRDEFGERISELQRTTAETAKRSSDGLAKDAASREARRNDLANRIQVLTKLGRQLEAVRLPVTGK